MITPHIRPEGDERWTYVANRHWMALLIRWLIPLLVGGGAGLYLLWRVMDRQPDFLGRTPPLVNGVNLLVFFTALVSLAALLYIYIDWRNDHLIVSNKRLIMEDQTLFLSFKYETIALDRIQNVNVRVDNFLQYMLKYGRVEVQAAGPTAPIVFDRAYCPNEIQRQVMKEVNREKREQEQRRLRAAVARRIDPSAPEAVVPNVMVERDIRINRSGWSELLPLAPVLEGNTITWHRHWIVLLTDLLWPLIALGLWVLALVLLPRYMQFDASTVTLILFFSLVAIMFAFFWQYDNWRNDIYILEPTRVIELSRLPFGLFEDRREAPLGVIQNVNATAPNLIARIFGYGDVLIETAGATGNFTFDHVPDPDQVQRIVFEYVERFKWQNREREWNNALNIVEMYEQARRGGTTQP
jgi:uncharacterized membrane protein YdbT with pleckstrin-like domain